MSEKYGVIPQRFTKKWWEYIWDYYKWFIIAGAFAISLALFTVYQVMSTPHYDLTVTLASGHLFGDDDVAKISELINANSTDINGDGEVNCDISRLMFLGDIQMDNAYNTKFLLSLQESDCLIYLMDKERFDALMAQGLSDEEFTSVNEWSDQEFSDEDCYIKDGIKFGVKISKSSQWNIDIEDDTELYLAVRRNYIDTEETDALYKACLDVARELIK